VPSVPSAPAPVVAESTPVATSDTASSSEKSQASAEAEPFHSTVGAVFNGSDVDVSFRVAHDPEQIVVVYRNAQTGEVVNQVPSEAIIQLAEFFQREATGALFDQGV
jgi:uncharacterized FlaG/YvyC family protein